MTCFFCICTSLKTVLAKASFVSLVLLVSNFLPSPENYTLQIDAILLAPDSKKEVDHCKNKHVKLKSALLQQEMFPFYITLITFFFFPTVIVPWTFKVWHESCRMRQAARTAPLQSAVVQDMEEIHTLRKTLLSLSTATRSVFYRWPILLLRDFAPSHRHQVKREFDACDSSGNERAKAPGKEASCWVSSPGQPPACCLVFI